MTNDIVSAQPIGGVLNPERYQTFELAKENDTVLGGDNIAQIRSYAAYARAQAQAIHKTIAATSGIDDVAAIKQEALETEQTFAKVGIYADQRIGEILRELPTRQGARTDKTSVGMPTKVQAEREANIDHHTSIDLQKLAANPDVVQAVLDRAESEGRIPSRQQVLDAIRERDAARADAATARKVGETLRRERDEAREDAEGYGEEISDLQEEIAALEKQADKAYEDGYNAATRSAQPRVVERVVESDATKKRISDLEHERDVYLSDVQKLRKRNEDMRRELDKAKDMLGMDKTLQDVRKDVQYLINATNQYVRQYGGLTWTAASFEQVEPHVLDELRTAAINLATFANALVASLEDFNGNR